MAYPFGVPFYLSLRVDGWVLAFVATLVGVTALLMGVLPSWRATSIDVATALREGGRSDSRGVRGSRTRNILVVSELAFSVVLLVGAVLLIRSYTALSNIELGFDQEGLLAARVSLPPAEYTERAKRIALLGPDVPATQRDSWRQRRRVRRGYPDERVERDVRDDDRGTACQAAERRAGRALQ